MTDVAKFGHGALPKNEIINGGLDFWQRQTSFTGLTGDVAPYTADRYEVRVKGTLVCDVTREADVPDELGDLVDYSLKAEITTDQAVIAGDVRLWLVHKIEGNNFTRLAQNHMTKQFWVKTNKPGKYAVAMWNSGADKYIIRTFTVSGSGVWTKIPLVFPASPEDGTWDYGVGTGVNIAISLVSGTTWQGTEQEDWADGSQKTGQADCVNLADTIGNYFQIAAVGLVQGTTPSPFSRAGGDFEGELAKCQRYFEKSYSLETVPGTGGASARMPQFSFGLAATGKRQVQCYWFKTRKRIEGSACVPYDYNGAFPRCSAMSDANWNAHNLSCSSGASETWITCYHGGGRTDHIVFNWTADAEL